VSASVVRAATNRLSRARNTGLGAMRSWFARGGWPVAAANPAAVAYTLLPPPFSSAMPTTRRVVGLPPMSSCTLSPAPRSGTVLLRAIWLTTTTPVSSGLSQRPSSSFGTVNMAVAVGTVLIETRPCLVGTPSWLS
jgi:hypothetical protein